MKKSKLKCMEWKLYWSIIMHMHSYRDSGTQALMHVHSETQDEEIRKSSNVSQFARTE